MPEKALARMKDGTEHVLTAQPYEAFWSKIAAIPGDWTAVDCLYVSIELEGVIRARWGDLNLPFDSAQRLQLRGLGDLPLEKSAGLHARLDTVWEMPHYGH